MDWPAQIPDFNITENMGCAGEEVSGLTIQVIITWMLHEPIEISIA